MWRGHLLSSTFQVTESLVILLIWSVSSPSVLIIQSFYTYTDIFIIYKVQQCIAISFFSMIRVLICPILRDFNKHLD